MANLSVNVEITNISEFLNASKEVTKKSRRTRISSSTT